MGGIDEEFWFEKSLIFIVVFSLVRIWWAQQFIRWGVDLSGDVFNDEIVLLEVGVPSCCSVV